MRNLLGRSLLAEVLIVTWATLCIMAYFIFSGSRSTVYGSTLAGWGSFGMKLARIDLIGYVWAFVRSLAGLVIFCLACLCAGAPLLPLILGVEGRSPVTTLRLAVCAATTFVIGQGFLSIALLTLAELDKLSPGPIVLVLAGAVLAGIPGLISYSRSHPPQTRLSFRDLDRPGDTWVLVLCAAIAVLTSLFAKARLSYDSVAIYFSDAKLTALTHSVRYFVGDTFVASVFHTAVVYSALIELFGDQTARMFSWISGLVVALVTVALAERVGLSSRARLMAAVLVMSTSALIDLMGDGKIDLTSGAPALIAIYWLVARGAKPGRDSSLLTGLLAGMAMAARPFNIPLLAMIIGLFATARALWGQGQSHASGWRGFCSSVLWISVGAAPWFAYHLLTNWIILGDPWSFVRNAMMVRPNDWQWTFSPASLWYFRLFYPVTVTFVNTPQSLGSVSPLVLASIPTLALPQVRQRIRLQGPYLWIEVAAAITLVAWILGTFLVFEIRYVFFLWMILYLPVAALLEAAVAGPASIVGRFVRLMILGVLGFMALRTIYIAVDTYAPINPQGNPQCYDLALCSFLTPINDAAQPGARVLTLNAFRYYLRPDLLQCSTSAEEYGRLQDASRVGGAAFWTEVYREGYHYVAYEREYSVRHLRLGLTPSPENAPPWLAIEPISGIPGDPQVAYAIEATDPPVQMGTECVRTGDHWELRPATPLSK